MWSRPDFAADITANDRMEVLFTFHADKAEMYLGKSAVDIGFSTAMYMLRQKDSMPDGMVWGDSFPGVVNHTTSSEARHHPDFHATKKGDFATAMRLVDALVKDEKVMAVAMQYPSAHVAYIHRWQGDGINMIPATYAAKFAAAGMTVEHDIIAVTNVSHTNASDIDRLSRRVRFEGNVTKRVSYILLDDFITSGAELRDMRGYISSRGGNVVAKTTFGHGSFGKLRDIGIDNNYKEKLKQAGISDQDLRRYGIASAIGCLTISEAAKLERVVKSRRTDGIAQEYERLPSLRHELSAVQPMAKEVPRTEEHPKVTESATHRSFMCR